MISLLFFLVLANSCYADWPSAGSSSKVCFQNDILPFVCKCQSQQVDCSEKNIQELNEQFLVPNETWSINFSRNQMTDLRKSDLEKIWLNISSIRAIDFSRNLIKNVEPNSFELLPSLEVLDLSHNNLSELANNVFENMASLQTLILSENHLHYLRREWFDGLTNLIRLDLSYNPIGLQQMDLNVDFFSPLKQLRYLNLANCSFYLMPLNLFENNTKLNELSLARNPLDQIPTTQLYSLRASLEMLDMTEIDIGVIRNHEFHGMFFLKKLLLNNLRFLEHIEPLAFHDLKSLEVLECQNNKQLTSIDPFAFYDNMEKQTSPNRILEVYLNNNGLKTISKSLLDFKESELIQIEGNPFVCDCKLEWMATEFRSEIPALEFSEFLVCSSPDNLKDFPIKHMTRADFNCADEKDINWMTTVLLSASLFVLSLISSLLGYIWIVKKHFPNVLPKTNLSDNKTKTRLVFHFERLFHKSHPNVPNAAKYQQLNRGGSSHSAHSSFFEEQQQQQHVQSHFQQQLPQQHLENPGYASNHIKNEFNLAQVHVIDAKDKPT